MAPLVVVGGLILYSTQHPEQSVPFMVQMANDVSQALTNPIGFATATIGDAIVVASTKPKDWAYYPKPETVPDGFTKVKPKTVSQGGKLRPRWIDEKGNIYEWDFQHGRMEKYTSRGKHLGEIDPETGEETKPADPSRSIEP